MIKAIIRHFRMKAYRERVNYLDEIVSKLKGDYDGSFDKGLKEHYYKELAILNAEYGVIQ